jgi:hypothetical protein
MRHRRSPVLPANTRSVGRGHWLLLAQEAIKAIAGAYHSEIGPIYERLGQQFGLNAHVVRRAVHGLNALQRIKQIDPQLADQLRHQPMVVTEIIARWIRHDQQAAVNAASRYLDGAIVAAKLAAHEKAARPRQHNQPKRSQRRQNSRDRIGAVAYAAWNKVTAPANGDATISIPYASLSDSEKERYREIGDMIAAAIGSKTTTTRPQPANR